MSSFLKRREFLLGIIIVVSIFIYVPYFVEVPPVVTGIESWLISTTVVVASVAIWVGVYTQARREAIRMRRRTRGWPYGLWMAFLTFIMIIFGIAVGTNAPLILFLSNAFVVPGDATIYALLVFFLTSSAARAFKVRDVESLLLMITAFVLILKQAPMTENMFPWISPIGTWLNDYLAMSASRVFSITAALGGIVLAIRLLMGREMAMIGIIRRKEADE